MKTECLRLGSHKGGARLAKALESYKLEREQLSALQIRIEGIRRDLLTRAERQQRAIEYSQAEYLKASIRRVERLLDLDPLQNEEVAEFLEWTAYKALAKAESQ